MTPEAQRIAIAEACGWTLSPLHEGKDLPFELRAFVKPYHASVMGPNLPDYPADLNACHEMELIGEMHYYPNRERYADELEKTRNRESD